MDRLSEKGKSSQTTESAKDGSSSSLEEKPVAFDLFPAGVKLKQVLILEEFPDSPPKVMCEQLGAGGLKKDSGVRMDPESLGSSGQRLREGLGV